MLTGYTVIRGMKDMDKRKLLPDVVRGFAVILVVLGHSIQELNGAAFRENALYFENIFYRFIYSFHMPLFMIFAGYFSCYALIKAKDLKEKTHALFKKLLTCLVPVFVWSLLDLIRLFFEARIKGVGYPYTKAGDFFNAFYNNLWFLWAVAILYLLVWLVHVLLHDFRPVYAVIYLALFFIPDSFNLHIYKYMFPFFLAGYFAYMHEDSVKAFYEKRKVLLLSLSLLIFVCLFAFFRTEVFIYVGGYRIFNAAAYKMLALDIYRTFIGFAGSIFFIILFDLLISFFTRSGKSCFKILKTLGQNSMGIYIIQGYVIILCLSKISDRSGGGVLFVIFGAIVTLLVSLLLTLIIAKVPKLGMIVGK